MDNERKSRPPTVRREGTKAERPDQSTPIEDPDDRVDEAVDESFPASDPPSFTPSRTGPPSKEPDKPGTGL